MPGEAVATNDHRSGLSTAVEILQLVNLMSPTVVLLFKSLGKGLANGLTVEEILASEDQGWQDIRSKAEAEIAAAKAQQDAGQI